MNFRMFVKKSWNFLREPYVYLLLWSLVAAGITIESIPIAKYVPDWLRFNKHTLDDTLLFVQVRDASTLRPISKASIIFKDVGKETIFQTDSRGVAGISLPRGKFVRVVSVADGYDAEDTYFDLMERPDPNVSILLTPAKIMHKPINQEPYEEICRSGPVSSGGGREFSSWYEVRSSPPKPGYVIDLENTKYSLFGDRRCNEWSECRLEQQSQTEVKFLFRMQGHNEWSPSTPAYSEGILKVQFKYDSNAARTTINNFNELESSKAAQAAFFCADYESVIQFVKRAESLEGSGVWKTSYPFLAGAFFQTGDAESGEATLQKMLADVRNSKSTYLSHSISRQFLKQNLEIVKARVPDHSESFDIAIQALSQLEAHTQ